MSSNTKVCTCRWGCGEGPFGPDGITNHETFCDENPNHGVPVEKQKELGIFPDELKSGGKPGETTESVEPDPDQRASATDGGSLPPRRTRSPDKKGRGSEENPEKSDCPNCGSSEHIPTEEAVQGFQSELSEMPDALRLTLEATRRYCNNCWNVWGDELENPHPIMENPEGAA